MTEHQAALQKVAEDYEIKLKAASGRYLELQSKYDDLKEQYELIQAESRAIRKCLRRILK